MGAIASGGVRVMNPMPGMTVSPQEIAAGGRPRTGRTGAARAALPRRQAAPSTCAGRTVIVVDDGLATGSTMRAAVLAIRQQHPARLVVAVPVGAAGNLQGAARPRPTKWCAPPCPARSAPWACGTANFRRPATTRSTSCWTRPAASMRWQRTDARKEQSNGHPATRCDPRPTPSWSTACAGTCSRCPARRATTTPCCS